MSLVTTVRLGKWDKVSWKHFVGILETKFFIPRDAAFVEIFYSLISLFVIPKLMHGGRVGAKVS